MGVSRMLPGLRLTCHAPVLCPLIPAFHQHVSSHASRHWDRGPCSRARPCRCAQRFAGNAIGGHSCQGLRTVGSAQGGCLTEGPQPRGALLLAWPPRSFPDGRPLHTVLTNHWVWAPSCVCACMHVCVCGGSSLQRGFLLWAVIDKASWQLRNGGFGPGRGIGNSPSASCPPHFGRDSDRENHLRGSLSRWNRKKSRPWITNGVLSGGNT